MRGKPGTISSPRSAGTAPRAATEQDAALQSQLAAIIEATQDGVALIDRQGVLRYVNPAGRTFLNIQREDQISTYTLLDFCPPELRTVIQEEALPTVRQTGQWRAEVELIDSQQRPLPVLLVLFSHQGQSEEDSLFSLILRDISEQKHREAELAHLAHHDTLTGLFNRRRFQEELESRLAHGRRYGDSGAVLFIDVDNLKQMNDTFGHQAGDTVLVKLAALFRTQLREVDVIARIGGDEFAVLLSSSDTHNAPAVAARLVRAVQQHTTEVASDGQVRCTISIGVALFPQHGVTTEELLKEADIALYQAKAAGRDQYRIFTAEMKQ